MDLNLSQMDIVKTIPNQIKDVRNDHALSIVCIVKVWAVLIFHLHQYTNVECPCTTLQIEGDKGSAIA
jgi:hypothetical protein